MAATLVGAPPRTAAELAERCAETGVVVEQPATEADLHELEAFLARWLTVVDADTPRLRADRLNELLAETSAYPRLTDHAGDGWHIHYRDSGLRLAAVLRALISVGTALHLSGRGMDRLRRCALAECHLPFGDFTRGGRQRYCSPTCANRDAVRRHRAKAAGAQAAPTVSR